MLEGGCERSPMWQDGSFSRNELLVITYHNGKKFSLLKLIPTFALFSPLFRKLLQEIECALTDINQKSYLL